MKLIPQTVGKSTQKIAFVGEPPITKEIYAKAAPELRRLMFAGFSFNVTEGRLIFQNAFPLEIPTNMKGVQDTFTWAEAEVEKEQTAKKNADEERLNKFKTS